MLIHHCSKGFEHWKLERASSLYNEATSEIILISLLVAVAILKLDGEVEDKKFHSEMAAGTLTQFPMK